MLKGGTPRHISISEIEKITVNKQEKDSIHREVTRDDGETRGETTRD